ncbi:putative polysaccharide biosynthesis protein [Paenibacillus beijingensis]|uniref:Membrane protein n=1 Tax=Paenibacillus beijingensis TaxID=1126833 RepID=A0A0D5NMD1_9BACL|nr:polysaccharide biosynthesis protein [Paenibacillus beijingensis]AJY76093.1 membrane protein [Paenibacillus beijingensis]
MTKQTFIKGAMILLAAGILNRILGFVPRIVLPRIIGAEGVGLYQLSFPFLGVLLTVITGGIPLAVAKWIAEAESKGDTRRVGHIFRAAMALTLILAFLTTAGLLAFAPWITSHLLTDSRVYQTFLFMTPMLFIVGLSSVYRGYFQGKQNMVPTAVSQVVETLIRIGGQLLIATALLPLGLEWAAAGAMLGVVAGEVGGLAVLLYQYRKAKRRDQSELESPGSSGAAANDNAVPGNNPPPNAPAARKRRVPIVRRLLGLSIPVTASRMVGSLSYLLETILTSRALLAAGIATGSATAQYGSLQGMIIPLILLPTALTYSLAVSLVPSLAEAAARGDRIAIHKRLHQSMRLALVTGAPCVVVMGLLAEPLCRVLYDHGDIAPMLQLLAPFGLFIYLQAPLQAALQALDKPGTALMNTFVGAVVKLYLITELTSRPELGIYGTVIAIGVNIVLVTLLHAFSVARFVGFRMKLPDFVKVGAAMIVMGAACRLLMNRGGLPAEWLSLAAACFAGTVIYLLLMIAMGIIDRYDVARIPLLGRWFK